MGISKEALWGVKHEQTEEIHTEPPKHKDNNCSSPIPLMWNILPFYS
jgi:hypothetical protein